NGKCVILVLEGISSKLLYPWVEKGYLPNLAALLAHRGGTMMSHAVPYEASALQTAFTGNSPGEHGIYSYWKVHNYSYVPQIIESDQLSQPYFWQEEKFSRFKTGIINIFGTHPPYPVNGYLLTYLFKQSLHACYPGNLLRQMASKGLGYGHDVSVFYRGQAREEFLRGVNKVEHHRINAALHLLPEVDILVANLTLVDRVSHFYWQELEEDSPFTEKETVLYHSYRQLDEAVGRFREQLHSRDNLLIFSDIGFGPIKEFVSLNHFLEQAGFMKKNKRGEIEWENTLASESVQGSHGININVKGRYALGAVKTEDYARVRQEVKAYLRELLNPKTGLPMFSRVEAREDYYSGPHVEKAPDIIVEPADLRYPPMGDNYWADVVHRDYQSGWHRSDSFWTASGPQFGNEKKDATLYDIMPTILDICNMEIPPHLKGESLTHGGI
ncbi:MAG: hypothetical protein GY757_44975, partial [bacterium]|nr:hypothetical protein [bacterium]